MEHRSRMLRCALAAACIILLCGCVATPPRPLRTQLEIRQLQTRTYDRGNADTLKIMKAVLNVLQDEGFIVRNADKDLGFISASKEIDSQDAWETAFSVILQGEHARYRKNAVIDCSVNVTELGSEVRIRAIFQNKMLDNQGGTIYVQQVESPQFYEEFFAKVDKGLFLERHSF